MSETERVLEEISKSVAESVVGVPNSQEEAGGSTSGQTSLPRSGAKEESDSESELFRSPTGSRRLSFEELLHKDPRYKKRTMDDAAMKQLIAALTGIAQGSAQRRFDVRDVKDLVVQFDPDIPTTPTAEQWVDSIVKAAALYQGNDEWKLQCGILNLNGAAKLWFTGVAVNTWDEFKTALIHDFPTSVDAVGIHQAMINRKKLPHESLETYFYSHVALGRKGKLADEAIIKYIVLGLEGRFGTITQVSTLPELLKQLKWLAEVRDLKPTEGHVRPSILKSAKSSGALSANIKCYRCNGEGNDRYLIVDVPGVQLKQKKTSTIFAADRMKPWSVNASLEDSDDDNMSSEDSDETM
ncbi:AAEL005467-PA [Aedes aegypti]|uniref:AAEL005467-PA n=1 Tax=Aedes aegypti TaxID=7159 RepID=Q179X4_AEDAE|nr:AAEL005467-PA [Aedes aegypti]